ncbi:hypothetical protein MCEMIH16_00797 [Caulobacteraceae bacterium]
MMPLTRLLAIAAVSALLAGPAFAGSGPAPVDQRPVPDSQPMNPQPTAPVAADQMATPASAMAVDPGAPAVVLGSSPTPPDQAWRLKAGDPSVVTNGPVPDTAENRARYGAPISNGGRRTRPVGN